MPPPDEEVSGGKTAKNDKLPRSGMLAVYAERERPPQNKSSTTEVVEALAAAVTPDEDWGCQTLANDADDATVSFTSESIPPGAVSSEVIDASEFVEDAPPKAEDAAATEKNPEGSEYSRSVDNSGMREQFLAAGGTPSDLPPPPVETSTGASADEDLKQEILNKLKIDLNLVLPNSTPATTLNKVNGVVFGDFWPPNELDVRRVISLLFAALAVEEYSDNEKFLKTPLEDLRALLKAELDLRRAKKSEALPLPIFHKKRRGPPPLPR